MTDRERRHRIYRTLEEFASAAGIALSTLHRIETQGVKPNRKTERAIEAALSKAERKAAS